LFGVDFEEIIASSIDVHGPPRPRFHIALGVTYFFFVRCRFDLGLGALAAQYVLAEWTISGGRIWYTGSYAISSRSARTFLSAFIQAVRLRFMAAARPELVHTFASPRECASDPARCQIWSSFCPPCFPAACRLRESDSSSLFALSDNAKLKWQFLLPGVLHSAERWIVVH
jgi:hypothetical protein